jgi:hypothetical protein
MDEGRDRVQNAASQDARIARDPGIPLANAARARPAQQ